ncbi:hypothetical protein F3J44_15015 [Pantoea sp. Tr-811]|uniref:hypothetical protein n=1 Tax=Pantoea sp. Tr-811 TaxID=2608361 RepID=UPI00141E7222|nr:hypothetical protein [Pantoea sp. Tr-811]NIF27679.1 hypothetical protein [Pantoea sp. Tr-811]
MTHQFHCAFHPTPDDQGGVLNIGPASVSIDLENLRLFANVVGQIEKRRAASAARSEILGQWAGSENIDWAHISFHPCRESYSLRYNGVAWEAPADATIAAAAEARLFLDNMRLQA